MWKNENFCLTKKIFRQINSFVMSFSKFLPKICETKSQQFPLSAHCPVQKTRSLLHTYFRKIQLFSVKSKLLTKELISRKFFIVIAFHSIFPHCKQELCKLFSRNISMWWGKFLTWFESKTTIKIKLTKKNRKNLTPYPILTISIL